MKGFFNLNGEPQTFNGSSYLASYITICNLAGRDHKQRPIIIYTSPTSQGEVSPGDILVVTDGMHINCMVTGNA